MERHTSRPTSFAASADLLSSVRRSNTSSGSISNAPGTPWTTSVERQCKGSGRSVKAVQRSVQRQRKGSERQRKGQYKVSERASGRSRKRSAKVAEDQGKAVRQVGWPHRQPEPFQPARWPQQRRPAVLCGTAKKGRVLGLKGTVLEQKKAACLSLRSHQQSGASSLPATAVRPAHRRLCRPLGGPPADVSCRSAAAPCAQHRLFELTAEMQDFPCTLQDGEDGDGDDGGDGGDGGGDGDDGGGGGGDVANRVDPRRGHEPASTHPMFCAATAPDVHAFTAPCFLAQPPHHLW